MKRIIDYFLLEWKHRKSRKSLLLRGARQVGKTHSVRILGKTYKNFVEINFEHKPQVIKIFDLDLDPVRILRELRLLLNVSIIPGETLLFFDEIQFAPHAITALRYFYEMMPELHVIAAGSLLDFAIEKIGIPVGRVESLYMHPVSFIEFLAAIQRYQIIDEIMQHIIEQTMPDHIHDLFLQLLAQYCAIGGMPYALQEWIDTQDARACARAHTTILDSYRQDFGKYARTAQIKYVELIFNQIPAQLGHKFKYSLVEGEYRKRELAPALDLLVTAGIAHKVFYSADQGTSPAGQVDPLDYRVIFLDIGLAQTELEIPIAQWFLQPGQELANKGALIEALVGQEIAAYAMPERKRSLYYWHKESRIDSAEIDYLVQINHKIIPIEVKSNKGSTVQSMHNFLNTHLQSPYGIRFSMHNYSVMDKIHSYPLYAIAQVMTQGLPEMQAAIKALVD